jgi:glycosyltransferase involved in cell wall biosynthesis
LFKPGDPAMRDYRCILYPGKFHERKGVFELFRILKQVFEKDASAYFIFVGHHSKSNQQTLLDFIPESHHHRIQFIPAVPQQELLPLYQKAGIVIIPSRVEAFGLTAIEAMACGAATIMSDVSAAREIIDNDLNGILINPLNTEESAHRILNLLKDPDLLKKIGDAATLKVRKKFAGSQLMVENMACYLETAG